MKRILTSELVDHVGGRVLLQGWLQRERRLARVNFALVRDRAGLAQIVTALGLERWTSQLVWCGNVREATLFPRDRTRLSP